MSGVHVAAGTRPSVAGGGSISVVFSCSSKLSFRCFSGTASASVMDPFSRDFFSEPLPCAGFSYKGKGLSRFSDMPPPSALVVPIDFYSRSIIVPRDAVEDDQEYVGRDSFLLSPHLVLCSFASAYRLKRTSTALDSVVGGDEYSRGFRTVRGASVDFGDPETNRS